MVFNFGIGHGADVYKMIDDPLDNYENTGFFRGKVILPEKKEVMICMAYYIDGERVRNAVLVDRETPIGEALEKLENWFAEKKNDN